MHIQSKDTMERGNWSGKLDFFLSSIGYCVGLGNVWRFPYLAYRNGGASFLFPYIIMLLIAGLPLFFIELALGQFTSEGPITVWNMAPVFSGIGYGMVILNAVVVIYYNMIIAYAIYYMFVSFVNFDDDLPWSKCLESNWWNTPNCRDKAFPKLSDSKYNDTTRMNVLWNELYDKDCVNDLFVKTTYSDYSTDTDASLKYDNFWNGLMDKFPNVTSFAALTHTEVQGYSGFSDCKIRYTSASEEYFERFVLRHQNSPDIGDLGDISVKLIITLFFAWMLIFVCLMRGIKTSGKVVYFTATFPYVILIVLLVRGVTLEGFMDGINFYVIPEWDKLTDAKIWNDAASQIFFSLGIGFGGILTMASYNKFKNNCYRDAIAVAFINSGTSIFAGFAIFSLLGHMAHLTNQDVSDVATSGPGLAFVAYPDGIARLPGSSVWAFLFFFMITTLGMDTQFVMMETVISGVSDIFPSTLRKYKTQFTFICCIVGFLLGIPQCTHGGIRVLTLMSDYSGSYNLMILAMFELLCLCYVYGLNNFREDIEMMIGFKPQIYWMACWCFITPVALSFIIIMSAIQYVPSGYDGQTFPKWAEGIGWTMVGVPIAAVFVVGVIQLFRYGYPGCIKPLDTWGPSQDKDRTGRYAPINASVNNGFQDDDGNALPYTIDSNSPPTANNDSNGGTDQKMKEMSRL